MKQKLMLTDSKRFMRFLVLVLVVALHVIATAQRGYTALGGEFLLLGIPTLMEVK